jgi:hypothetical protein
MHCNVGGSTNDDGVDRKATGESDGDEWRQMSMTFNDDVSGRQGQGQVKL